jgi:hypothetical protein
MPLLAPPAAVPQVPVGRRLRVDAVEKVRGIQLTRNNRIIGLDFLNRTCAFEAHFESILLREPPKSFFDSIGHLETRSDAYRCASLDLRAPGTSTLAPNVHFREEKIIHRFTLCATMTALTITTAAEAEAPDVFSANGRLDGATSLSPRVGRSALSPDLIRMASGAIRGPDEGIFAHPGYGRAPSPDLLATARKYTSPRTRGEVYPRTKSKRLPGNFRKPSRQLWSHSTRAAPGVAGS